MTLLRDRCGLKTAREFGKRLFESNLAQLVSVSSKDRKHAWSVFTSHQDLVLSFTDCTSFTLMERLEMETNFTFDSDFQVYGFRMVP